METFLFDEIVYGPVNSRRLGVSLGVNLLPLSAKLCSFDCIYCECGFNSNNPKATLPTREAVKSELIKTLEQMTRESKLPDTITFSGNGEPTLHPDFPEIIADTLELKKQFCPKVQITVLTNSTQIHRPEIFKALKSIDNPFLKLDSAIEATIMKIDKPNRSNTNNDKGYSIQRVIEAMKQFNGDFVLQTMFLRGNYDGDIIDNTTEVEIEAYLKVLEYLKPSMVTIYTIDRTTPAKKLEKISVEELERIAEKIRKIIPNVQVSG